MSVQHTPGPWDVEIDDHPTEYWFDRGHICVGPAIIGNEYGDLCETDIANGRLIAAAPELLEALAELISGIGIDTDKDGDGLFDAQLTIGDLRKARAAIAKATELHAPLSKEQSDQMAQRTRKAPWAKSTE